MMRTPYFRGAWLALALTLASGTADARDFTQGTITIRDPWARPTDALAQTAAAYLTIENAGAALDRLVSVSSAAAESVTLHHMVNRDGMMSMQHVPALDVPAHGTASLRPGGYHVMFVNLKTPFTAGKTIPLVLTFEKAGSVTVQVAVGKPKGDASGSKMRSESKKDSGGGGMKMGTGESGGMKH